MDKGNYKGPKALYSLCETVVYKGPKALLSLCETMTIYKGPKALYSLCEQWSIRARRRCGDPFRATVIQTGSISSTQTGPRYQNLYAADLFFPNRHAYLSLYQVLSKQSMCILCSVHISYSRIIMVIRYHMQYVQSFILIFAFFISYISLYTCTYTYNISYTYVIFYTCHIPMLIYVPYI